MKIQVNELAAINEGTTDFSKRINIFCGQNNTGKTYIASVIYVLTREKISRNPFKINIVSLLENGITDIEINAEAIYQYKQETVEEIIKEN